MEDLVKEVVYDGTSYDLRISVTVSGNSFLINDTNTGITIYDRNLHDLSLIKRKAINAIRIYREERERKKTFQEWDGKLPSSVDR